MMEVTKFRRDETIAMEGDVARRSLFIIVNGNVSSVLGKDYDHYDDIMDTNLTMDNMKKHCILGAGTFGKVWLVEDTRNGNAYALKIQSKRTILSYSQSEGVCREKNIMANIDNPFVIKLVNA